MQSKLEVLKMRANEERVNDIEDKSMARKEAKEKEKQNTMRKVKGNK